MHGRYRRAVMVERTHPHRFEGAIGFVPRQFITDRQLTRNDRARNDRAMPLQNERTIDRHAKPLGLAALRYLVANRFERYLQFRDPRTRRSRCRKDRRTFEEGAFYQVFDFQFDNFAGNIVDEIGFREHDDAVLNVEQLQDFEVFAGLRHNRIVGGDDERDEVDAGCPRKHVFHEPLVAGNVDDAEVKLAERQAGETDIDGDAAGFLFG